MTCSQNPDSPASSVIGLNRYTRSQAAMSLADLVDPLLRDDQYAVADRTAGGGANSCWRSPRKVGCFASTASR